MPLYRCGTKTIKLNNFKYNLPQFNVFGGGTATLEIMPMKLTSLTIHVAEHNANTTQSWDWTPNLKARIKGTSTWEDLDTETRITVPANGIKAYLRVFTPDTQGPSETFNWNNEYDAIQFNLFDRIRWSYYETGTKPLILVSGTITDGNNKVVEGN